MVVYFINKFKLNSYDNLQERVKDLDPSKHYVLYCSSGNKSKTASEVLLKNGFNNVLSLKGGVTNFD